jgi:hypothetical protein
MTNEIILYQTDTQERIEVRIENDTVWLNRKQLAQLFGRDIKTIGKHISNALNEELQGIPVVAIFATTASDGKIYQTEHYNVDMILSIGYRVKSQRGIQFRMWALYLFISDGNLFLIMNCRCTFHVIANETQWSVAIS